MTALGSGAFLRDRILMPADTTTYIGLCADSRCIVRVVPGRCELPPRLDLANHSPDGFEWGYLGSGPAQLALALLAHATRDDARSLRLHQPFKHHYVASLARGRGWKATAGDIRTWATAIEDVLKRGGPGS